MRKTLLLLLLPLALVFADSTSTSAIDSTAVATTVVTDSMDSTTNSVTATIAKTDVVTSDKEIGPDLSSDEKEASTTDSAKDKKESVKKSKDKKNFAVLLFYKKLNNDRLAMFFFIIGGLGIFLLGMNHMSSGLQTVAGSKLRTMVGAVTNNRLFAATVGVVVTTIVQSSSVTTVMVVGFVNSGIMALNQALGVIFGANIGTTITGWLVALKVGMFGLPVLAVAALIYLFTKNDRLKYIAMATMGVGMVFFGLQLMKFGFQPLAKDEGFKAFFALFTADNYFGVLKCIFIGAILTAVVQSSSATLVIIISLATTISPEGNPVISFATASALVIGGNIGTTITAFLASINTNTAAKRAAYGHMLFNVLGVVWIVAIFYPYTDLVANFYNSHSEFFDKIFAKSKGANTNTGIQIAMVHTGFNVVNTLIFLPLLNPMAKLLYKIIPEKGYKEQNHLTSLTHVTMFESPDIALEEAKIEVDQMAEHTAKLGSMIKDMIASGDYDDKMIQKIFELEENLDTYQSEVTTFLMDILATKSLSHETVETVQRLFRLADEYESISDYFINIIKRFLMLNEQDLSFGKDEKADIIELHEKMSDFLGDLNTSVKLCKYEADARLITEADAVKLSFKAKRQAHLSRLSDTTVAPILSVAFMDVLTYYRRINDHMINISEVLQK